MDQRKAFEIVKKYIDYLKASGYDIQKAYIFGSYINGKFHEDSDIDLALIFNKMKNNYLMQIELMKLVKKFDSRIEPHPFLAEDFEEFNPFMSEIINNGVQIA